MVSLPSSDAGAAAAVTAFVSVAPLSRIAHVASCPSAPCLRRPRRTAAAPSTPLPRARRAALRACTPSPAPSEDDVAASSPPAPTSTPTPTPELKSAAEGASSSEAAGDEPSINGDLAATLAWVGVAAAAAAAVARWRGAQAGVEFVTAYILEYSLSVDNLFVFLLIFDYFRVPRASQTRVLGYGIWGAVVMRGAMIVAGAELVRRFKWVTVGFAGILLFSAAKLLLGDDDDDEDLSKSPVVRFARSLLPFTDQYDGNRFFTEVKEEGENGAMVMNRLATPLMLVLLSVELSDVVFALDSVPAVLGISDDAIVIYLSNVLAIAGLRNLFFVLSDSIGGLRFLPQALAIVLGFVGAKMIAGVAGWEIGTVQSLCVVVGTLAAGIGISIALPEEEAER